MGELLPQSGNSVIHQVTNSPISSLRRWQLEVQPRDVLGARAVDLVEDLRGERGWREYSRERSESQHPAPKRPVVADVQRQGQAAVLRLVGLLRGMPDTFLDVSRDLRL